MKHLLLILFVLGVAGIIYCGVHRQITREARAVTASEYPELAWLKREFSLDENQYARIKSLHLKQDETCRELCEELSKSQKKLARALAGEEPDSETFQAALLDWRKQRERSQDSILRHMFEVSREMDREQGARYRDFIYRNLILPGRTPHIDSQGEFHSRFIRHGEVE